MTEDVLYRQYGGDKEEGVQTLRVQTNIMHVYTETEG